MRHFALYTDNLLDHTHRMPWWKRIFLMRHHTTNHLRGPLPRLIGTRNYLRFCSRKNHVADGGRYGQSTMRKACVGYRLFMTILSNLHNRACNWLNQDDRTSIYIFTLKACSLLAPTSSSARPSPQRSQSFQSSIQPSPYNDHLSLLVHLADFSVPFHFRPVNDSIHGTGHFETTIE